MSHSFTSSKSRRLFATLVWTGLICTALVLSSIFLQRPLRAQGVDPTPMETQVTASPTPPASTVDASGTATPAVQSSPDTATPTSSTTATTSTQTPPPDNATESVEPSVTSGPEQATEPPTTQSPTAPTGSATLAEDATLSATRIDTDLDVTTTPTIRPATISITATIWAKVTATAAAAAASPTTEPTPTPTMGPDERLDLHIEEIIQEMSVADRVGQLFIIDFEGSQIADESDIVELIQEYRIGGVVLSPQNDNFSNANPNAPRQIATLINQLQALAYGVVLPEDQALNPPDILLDRPGGLGLSLLQQAPPMLPLLIGVEQNGDGIPSSSLRTGFTTLPPQMALGATWNPQLTEAVGGLVGQELSAVGINLLLGPYFDVLEQPRPDAVSGLGIHTFGGDAYWVGRLGEAYVKGIHTGSGGRVATIAGHFPGQGGTDRRPDEEVATIQKSLPELRRVELRPFANVTERASSILRTDGAVSATDGLMSSHIRYSSFQGSRERTPPISLAKELSTILALEEFAAWREQGGVLMSDALGVPAIRRYYDPTLNEFPRRRVALDAFLAGNDLLYLSRFSLEEDWSDTKDNIRETILFFREQYTDDPDFAARVDQSLRRILRLKLQLYSDDDETENLGSAVTPEASGDTANGTETATETAGEVVTSTTETEEDSDLEQLEGQDPTWAVQLSDVLVEARSLRTLSEANRAEAQSVIGQVAREALTILYPDPRGMTEPLPAPPQAGEQLLIFSDSRTIQECEDCPTVPAIAPTALEEVMVRLYGPDTTGQIQPDQITSLTFEQLNAMLNGTASSSQQSLVEEAITNADWLIFAMLDVDVGQHQSSDAVKQFLRLRSDRLRGKRTVVLAFNAPYFLDSTEISKLTAYIGLYSKTQPFLEAAVRAIFRSVPLAAAPPVNVPGTRYSNLIERLEPDPDQAIDLYLLNDSPTESETSEDAAATEEGIQADLSVGDVIEVETSIILDHNGNPVPDGTLVNFRLIYEGEAELALPLDPVPTENGVARIAAPIERSGTLRISASSVEADVSTVILVSIQGDATEIAYLNPTITPEPEIVSAANPAASENTASGSAAPLQSGESDQAVPPPQLPARVDLVTLALALITQLVTLGLLLVVLVRTMPRGMLVYRLLWALAIGWSSYILYGVGFIPGGTWLQLTLYPWGVIPVVFIGMLLPLVWLQLRVE